MIALRPTAHRIVLPELVQFSHGPHRVTLKPNDAALRALLWKLHHGSDRDELLDQLEVAYPKRIGQLGADLDRLVRAGVVRRVDRHRAPHDRFARTRTFLSQFADDQLHEDQLMSRLRRATVVVVGVGGIGSWILEGLIGLGIGHLRLADFDVVELSNLNRSCLFGSADVGRSKVEAAAEAIDRAYDDISVSTFAVDLASGPLPRPVVVGADCVISTADKPPWVARRRVAEACVREGVAFLCPSGYRVGPFHVGPRTACVMCEFSELMADVPNAQRSMEGISSIPESQPGSVPHIAASAAAVTIAETLWFLTGVVEPSTVNAIWTSEETLAASYVGRTPFAECVACGSGAVEPSFS